APVCKAIKRESFAFLLFNEQGLKKELERYDAPPEAVEAKLTVKRCVDSKLSFIERTSVAGALVCSLCFTHSEGHK
ncbi:Secretoglobin family 1D member 2, partial [Lemmus lemmus]